MEGTALREANGIVEGQTQDFMHIFTTSTFENIIQIGLKGDERTTLRDAISNARIYRLGRKLTASSLAKFPPPQSTRLVLSAVTKEAKATAAETRVSLSNMFYDALIFQTYQEMRLEE